MVCPFSAVHDISTAEAFIKQHGSSIVLKGSSAVLEFELPKVVRDFPFRSATSRQKTGGMGSITFGDIPPDITPMDTKDAQDCIKMALERLNIVWCPISWSARGQFITSKQSLFFNEFDVRPGDSEFVNILGRFLSVQIIRY